MFLWVDRRTRKFSRARSRFCAYFGRSTITIRNNGEAGKVDVRK